jgi:hypothetical protein
MLSAAARRAYDTETRKNMQQTPGDEAAVGPPRMPRLQLDRITPPSNERTRSLSSGTSASLDDRFRTPSTTGSLTPRSPRALPPGTGMLWRQVHVQTIDATSGGIFEQLFFRLDAREPALTFAANMESPELGSIPLSDARIARCTHSKRRFSFTLDITAPSAKSFLFAADNEDALLEWFRCFNEVGVLQLSQEQREQLQRVEDEHQREANAVQKFTAELATRSQKREREWSFETPTAHAVETAKREAEDKARLPAEEQARQEMAAAQAKRGADERARGEAERATREEEERTLRQAEQAKREATTRVRRDSEERARNETEERGRQNAGAVAAAAASASAAAAATTTADKPEVQVVAARADEADAIGERPEPPPRKKKPEPPPRKSRPSWTESIAGLFSRSVSMAAAAADAATASAGAAPAPAKSVDRKLSAESAAAKIQRAWLRHAARDPYGFDAEEARLNAAAVAAAEGEVLRRGSSDNLLAMAPHETAGVAGAAPVPPPRRCRPVASETKEILVQATSVMAGSPPFKPSKSFVGASLGYIFKMGAAGLGYYREDEFAEVEAFAIQEKSRRRSVVLRQELLQALHVRRSKAATTGDETGVQTSMHLCLARKQHWRRCPSCQEVVERCPERDLACACPSCGCQFRWALAPLLTPASSLGALLKEFEWQFRESVTQSGWVSADAVAHRYIGHRNPPACTETAWLKLQLWRAAVAIPLAVALPALTLKTRYRRSSRRLHRSVRSQSAPALPTQSLNGYAAPRQLAMTAPPTLAHGRSASLFRAYSSMAATPTLVVDAQPCAQRSTGFDALHHPTLLHASASQGRL